MEMNDDLVQAFLRLLLVLLLTLAFYAYNAKGPSRESCSQCIHNPLDEIEDNARGNRGEEPSSHTYRLMWKGLLLKP